MDTEVPPILQLNDDCLECIFIYLDFLELLNAERVCQRFEGIAQMCYKKFTSVDFDEFLSKFRKMGIRYPLNEVFKNFEHHMIAMKINGPSYEKIFGRPGFPISTFPKLQHIMLLEDNEIHEEYANIFPLLKEIILYYIRLSNERNESVFNSWFKNSPQLKILKLNNITGMTGECLVGLKGIEELKIYRCSKFQEEFFKQFCQMNPQLKKLSLNLEFINPNRHNIFLEIITKYLKNLESLVITIYNKGGYANFEILCDLPKVTKLHLDVYPDKQSSSFYQLLEHFATNNHIEYLNLPYVSEGAFSKLHQFPYLKVLKLNNLRDLAFEKFSNFSCSATLEELHIVWCPYKLFVQLKDFIQQIKTLKLLNVSGSHLFDSQYLMGIEEYLCSQTQMLEIVVTNTSLARELLTEPKSELKDFLERTKGKFKLTLDAFTYDGMPKKSFHKWEDWEGEQYDILREYTKLKSCLN